MRKPRPPSRFLAILVACFGAVALTACGGTKVYETTKTVVYNGEMFNISDVRQISSKIEGTVGDDRQVLELKNVDKKQFEEYVDEYGQVFVKMYDDLDDQQLVYRAQNVDRWRDFNSMKSDFENAGGKIAKLMRDSKSTQITLR